MRLFTNLLDLDSCRFAFEPLRSCPLFLGLALGGHLRDFF
jgi:hypothetical protein